MDRAIDAYATADRYSRHRITLTPGVVPYRPARWSAIPRPLWNHVAVPLLHLRLFLAIWRQCRSDLIIVHSFSTTIFAVAWPLFWPVRDRMLLIVHHNVTLAHGRPLERVVLRALVRLGFRFGLLESNAGLAEIGIEPTPGQFPVLPLPALDPATVGAARPDQPDRRAGAIGVIGKIRAEKRGGALMELLLQARATGALDREILLGCPDRAARERWAEAGARTVDTSTYAAYLAALQQCDVVVLDYDPSRYRYRSSGIITDAAALGVAVVCPDYPVFRRQVSEPAQVGCVFRDADEVVPAIRRALELKREAGQNFARWARARSMEEITRHFDALIERPRAQGTAPVGLSQTAAR